MNSEPVSISTLMTPVSTPTAAKAPLHAARPVAIGDGGGFDLSALEARTTRAPHDPMERKPPRGRGSPPHLHRIFTVPSILAGSMERRNRFAAWPLGGNDNSEKRHPLCSVLRHAQRRRISASRYPPGSSPGQAF